MKTASCKAKGNALTKLYKNMILNHFQPAIMDADVSRTTSGVTGMDIKGSTILFRLLPFATECKNSETLSVWAAYKQACTYVEHDEDTGIRTDNKMPLAIMHKNRSSTLAILDANDFLSIMRELAGYKYPELFK